jgi:HTH-type transcriptional regulator/antitoxin HigA
MFTIFNQEVYTDLLSEVIPKIIETEAEYEQTLATVEALTFNQNRTPEQTALYKLLVMLVEVYETERYPIQDVSPVDVLNHIMAASGTRQADLVGIIGSSGVVSEIVNGKRTLSKAQAKILADRFKVSLSLFI